MTSKLMIDQAAVQKQIQKALAGTASVLANSLQKSINGLPVAMTKRTDGVSHEFILEGTTELTPQQILDGVVTKAGQRIAGQPFVDNALSQVDLAAEFGKRF